MPVVPDVPRGSAPPPHTIVVYAGKVRVALLAIAALALGGIGVYMALDPGNQLSQLRVVAGIALTILGAMSVVNEVAIFLSPRPQLIVNGEGIWLNSWTHSRVLGVPFIDWDNIAFLLARRQNIQSLLRIALVDADALSARQTRLQRFAFVVLTDNLAGFRMITYADGQLATSTEEILRQIEEQFHHELKHNHVRVIRGQRRHRVHV